MKPITYYQEEGHLDELGEKYFPNSKIRGKHLTYFKETTPQGNRIEGYINRKPNRYLGSMIILNVNNEPVEQFIQSMPKIHYYHDPRDIPAHGGYNYCYEKLDGSCLIIYPLKNKDGEIIEIIPKTRGRPVADKNFQNYYNKIDQKPIIDYYNDNDGILIFELYGIINQHEIIHYDTGIDIRLIGIYTDNEFLNSSAVAFKHNFKLPDQIFSLYNIKNEWYLKWTSEKYKAYKPEEYKNEDKYYPTITDAIDGIQYELEQLNKKYYTINKRIATEGVVINTFDENGTRKWLKCKPRDIEQKHKTVNGIPRRSITKECLKYFDEYGSDVKEIYLKDKNHHTEYLHRQLKEEYSEELIQKSSKKIEKTFMQIWENREIPESIHLLAEEIYNKYHKQGISNCMRLFAQEKPMLKNKSRQVYQVLEKLFIKHGEQL